VSLAKIVGQRIALTNLCVRFFVIDGFLDVTMTSTAQADVDFRMESAPQGDQELLFEIKVRQTTGRYIRRT
jgi:hypothetical protein